MKAELCNHVLGCKLSIADGSQGGFKIRAHAPNPSTGLPPWDVCFFGWLSIFLSP